ELLWLASDYIGEVYPEITKSFTRYLCEEHNETDLYEANSASGLHRISQFIETRRRRTSHVPSIDRASVCHPLRLFRLNSPTFSCKCPARYEKSFITATGIDGTVALTLVKSAHC
ncbi:hypothetical protein Tcan_09060, partial [Toxocara canis]